MEDDEERAQLWNGDHLKSSHGLHQITQILLILMSIGFGVGAKCNDISIRSNINELLLLLSLTWVLLILIIAFELANLPHEIKLIRERKELYNKIVMDRVPLVCGTAIIALLFTVSSHGDNLMGVAMILAYLAAVALLHQRKNKKQRISSRERERRKDVNSVETAAFSSDNQSDPDDSDDLEDSSEDPPPFRVTLTRHSTTNADD